MFRVRLYPIFSHINIFLLITQAYPSNLKYNDPNSPISNHFNCIKSNYLNKFKYNDSCLWQFKRSLLAIKECKQPKYKYFACKKRIVKNTVG